LPSSLLSKNLKFKIYRNILLFCMVLKLRRSYLREESRLREFDNRVLRRIFETKRDEVKRKWRKLLYEELNDFTPHLWRTSQEQTTHRVTSAITLYYSLNTKTHRLHSVSSRQGYTQFHGSSASSPPWSTSRGMTS